MNNFESRFKVIRHALNNPLINAMLSEYYGKTSSPSADLIFEVFEAGAENDFCGAVQSILLRDDNAFSKACAKDGNCSEYLKFAYLQDLNTLFKITEHFYNSNDFSYGAPLPVFKAKTDAQLIERLREFYAKNGYGILIGNRAFEYRGGEIYPMTGISDITLSQLKDYETEKKAVTDNVKDFLSGLPYSHMLLYGDRGTGKSSTVNAVLNEFYDSGLRLVEIGKEELHGIKQLKQTLSALPLKYIVFIDDISLSEQEMPSTLKAAVEGSVTEARNVMIVATSNRRHIVKESFSERENSVHPSDGIEEQLSLSDRFGLTVMFSTTGKSEYLSIVRQLANDLSLTTPVTDLEALAERWAILNGGRSPRKARQFTDFVYACEKSGRPIEF